MSWERASEFVSRFHVEHEMGEMGEKKKKDTFLLQPKAPSFGAKDVDFPKNTSVAKDRLELV